MQPPVPAADIPRNFIVALDAGHVLILYSTAHAGDLRQRPKDTGMAETTTSSLIRAPRPKVYSTIADIHALAKCLQPEGTSSRMIDYDRVSGSPRMEITHGPGPQGTRRFRLVILEMRKDEEVVYAAAFESDDPSLAGEMKLRFALKDAPGGTQITVRHEGIPPGISVRDNERGSESSLKNLARLVEGRET
jgi:uncharacterized protein YndB with AHSA1/START domain